jgi:hypothetical protein
LFYLVCTLLCSSALRLFLPLFIFHSSLNALTPILLVGIYPIFDEAYNREDEVEEDYQKSDEDNTSLAVLDDCVSHIFLNQLNLKFDDISELT